MRRAAAILSFAVLAFASVARADDAVEKPVSTLIKAVRYQKDDLALKQLDGDAQGVILLGDDWTKATAAEKTEFTTLFQALFAGLAFPKIRDNLQNLGTTLYEKPVITGDKATLVSTLAIDHPLKKEEIKVQFDIHKVKGAWKVVDVTVLGVAGKSMLTDIHDDQIVPIMKEGGLPHLLDAMRKRRDSLPPPAKK